MKTFKIYENAATKQVEAVKQGFAWWGFWFNGFWCLSCQLYLQGILILVGSVITGGIVGLLGSVLLGFKGNELRESNLLKRGYEVKETLVAGNKEGALAIYMAKQK